MYMEYFLLYNFIMNSLVFLLDLTSCLQCGFPPRYSFFLKNGFDAHCCSYATTKHPVSYIFFYFTEGDLDLLFSCTFFILCRRTGFL